MALYFASLNSGSNGNCYYVGNDMDAVLVDVGISCRETEKRLKQLQLDVKKIKAVFVSHEHTDHIKGVSVFSNKYNLPVFITHKTAKKGPFLIGHLAKNFKADTPVQIGSISITAFAKQHDADDPHSFVVSSKNVHVGVFTDIGKVCDKVSYYFKQCHAVFLESNYDDAMLENGTYPLHLKNRIRGGQGHLSNSQSLELFLNCRPAFMTHLLLSHLSKENNHPDLALSVFKPHAGNVNIAVAPRHDVSELYCIANAEEKKMHYRAKPVQMGLFPG